MKKLLFAALLVGVTLPTDAAVLSIQGYFGPTNQVLADPTYVRPIEQ